MTQNTTSELKKQKIMQHKSINEKMFNDTQNACPLILTLRDLVHILYGKNTNNSIIRDLQHNKYLLKSNSVEIASSFQKKFEIKMLEPDFYIGQVVEATTNYLNNNKKSQEELYTTLLKIQHHIEKEQYCGLPAFKHSLTALENSMRVMRRKLFKQFVIEVWGNEYP